MKALKKTNKDTPPIISFSLMGVVGLSLVAFSFLYLNSDLNGSLNTFISQTGGLGYDQVSYATQYISRDMHFLLTCSVLGTVLLMSSIYEIRKRLTQNHRNQ